MLRFDHNIVSSSHYLSFRQTNRMPLNYFLDISLRDSSFGREIPTEEESRMLSRSKAGTKGEHLGVRLLLSVEMRLLTRLKDSDSRGRLLGGLTGCREGSEVALLFDSVTRKVRVESGGKLEEREKVSERLDHSIFLLTCLQPAT